MYEGKGLCPPDDGVKLPDGAEVLNDDDLELGGDGGALGRGVAEDLGALLLVGVGVGQAVGAADRRGVSLEEGAMEIRVL